MRRTLQTTIILCLAAAAAAAAQFRSAWPKSVERVWVGPEYWSNRLQDWRVAGGRLECTTSGGDRNVHLLTRQLGPGKGDLAMSVRLGTLGDRKPSAGWAGFRVGILGYWKDYRDSVRRGRGLDAGVSTDGQLFIGSPKAAKRPIKHRGIPRKDWTVHHVTSQETDGVDNRATNAFDGRAGTIWHSQYIKRRGDYPYEFQLDLGDTYEVCGIAYLPRQDKSIGRIKGYEAYVSDDAKDWGDPVASGTWPDTDRLQTVRFKAREGRYLRLVPKSGIVGDRPACAIAELFVLDPQTVKAKPKAPPKPEKALPLGDLELRLTAEPDGDSYQLTLTALQPESGTELDRVTRTVAAEALVGNVALVCHAAVGRGRRSQRAGGHVRFWFRDWRLGGSKVEAHPDHAFGPILWCQHTLSRNVLKLTAQMPPVGKNEAQTVRLEVRKDGQWTEVAKARIHPLARTATFRVPEWDSTRDTPYRAVYAMTMPDGSRKDHTWQGTIRKSPVDKDPIVVAAFTGNADYAFPNLDLVRHVTAHDPDVLFFSGDNIYENVGGYGIERQPLERACLDYLRKWYYFGWAYADLVRDRPCISIPDDHDVYQGNLWGHGGRKCPGGINTGGYAMHPEWVKTVERTQTSNLPDPYDPTPVDQGIGVYYTDMVYGGVSFAVVEDRKFKTGPQGLVPKTKARSDHVIDPNFDPQTADVPGARLLGERQLEFLNAWAADWRGCEMKCALSQTTFCGVATHHGGGLRRLIADYDSNGWPQTGRRKALEALRKGFAFHIGGDQHLATIVHHGIDTWGDATWSFAVPSVANFYLRAWRPEKPGKNRQPGMPPYTGQFRDGFGNPITVWAATNPGDKMGHEPAALHDKKPGYGIVRFHKAKRTITIECWPLFADPRDPKTGGQYEGWPKTITQRGCYAREAKAWLPTVEVEGMT
ncbi:MAG: discoidin domain-containing protein, partial [Planctomycetota bacterium]